jgi:hypothetical protein
MFIILKKNKKNNYILFDKNKRKVLFLFIFKAKKNYYSCFSLNTFFYLHLLNILSDFGLNNRFFFIKSIK